MIFLLALILAKSIKKNNLFDIVYLNLDRAVERKEHTERLLNFVGCSFQRFNAVNGIKILEKNAKIEEYTDGLPIHIDVDKYFWMSNYWGGMIGCKLSQQIILKKIELSNTTKPTVVLQDDIDIDENFVKITEDAINSAPSDWDIILLCPYYIKNKSTGSKIDPVVKIDFFIHSLAYIVNGSKSAKKIGEGIESASVWNPVDICMGLMAKNGCLNAYALKNPIVTHIRHTFKSDVPTSTHFSTKKVDNSVFKIIQSDKIIKN